jgi:hypothetical protein
MKQLILWEPPPPVIWHHHIEIIWLSGYREVVCTAQPVRGRPGDWQCAGGFVGDAVMPDECSVCHPKVESVKL